MTITTEERTALALAALAEVTDPADVGELLGVDEVEPGVLDLRFACRLAAYRDWHWTVSTSDLPDVPPTVLEVELLPGEGSLLAPPWVPWAERLAEWRKQHPDERHPGESEADDESAEDADLDEDDLAVDDDLDELDEAELEGVGSPEEADQDDGDLDNEDDDLPPRPGDVDRSL
ncbi:DUF3027 domain-containing protein [Amnibacterium kyonggiense]|uniref:DUF3027 family protein n=1 Tax=Amnibacterium kyonggiense TaxID=595671 RepID=A0A4R7FRG4_9MICO|nr:DUF3027 domain-containing protein [Amnibacterium kyonggiense]TDS80412.1 Protein of unknown function (DUF3027) [Amnibacterium kyonggiense]